MPPTKAVVCVLQLLNGEIVGQVMALEKTFRTGSRGYFGNDKVVIDGKRYQVQVQLVEIGSKPKE